MRSFLAAMAVCALSTTLFVGWATPYGAPGETVVATAPTFDIPLPEAAEVDLTLWHPATETIREDKTFTTDGIPLPKPREGIKRPSLLALAQAQIGRNPTGWRSLWCARFVALLAPELARKVHNPNWARDWARLPKAARKPGAIVVLTRSGGGHIGIVKGFTRRGDPIVISGNARGKRGHRVVAEAVYPKSRVIAYVGG